LRQEQTASQVFVVDDGSPLPVAIPEHIMASGNLQLWRMRGKRRRFRGAKFRERSFHQCVDRVRPLPCSTRPDWPQAGSHYLDIAVWLGATGIAASSLVQARTRIARQELRTLHRN
jgi:hypothetical protein